MATVNVDWPLTTVMYAYDADDVVVYKKSFSTFFGSHLDYGVDERFPKQRSGLEKVARAFVRDLNRIGRWGDNVTAVVQIVGGCPPQRTAVWLRLPTALQPTAGMYTALVLPTWRKSSNVTGWHVVTPPCHSLQRRVE